MQGQHATQQLQWQITNLPVHTDRDIKAYTIRPGCKSVFNRTVVNATIHQAHDQHRPHLQDSATMRVQIQTVDIGINIETTDIRRDQLAAVAVAWFAMCGQDTHCSIMTRKIQCTDPPNS